ncbi:MAG TPA: type II secretion system protein [Vicinamibacterales bacterium]|nr:type II secretion system protein [Vicinamibacterales bacterium]
MAALIVGLAVMAIMMTVAMPVWKHLAQREKEEELVFRGEAYAHAIGMFQRRNANAYPPNLDVLVQGKFIRKKYKDPITDDDFVPLAQGQQQGAQRGNQPGQQGGAQQGRGGQPGQGIAGAAAPGQPGAIGGIIGVTSKSTAESIRLYKGRSHYNEWAFIYTPPAQAPGGVPGAGVPGANPARGNRGAQPQTTPFPGQRGGATFPQNPARGNNPQGPGPIFQPFPNGGRGR